VKTAARTVTLNTVGLFMMNRIVDSAGVSPSSKDAIPYSRDSILSDFNTNVLSHFAN